MIGADHRTFADEFLDQSRGCRRPEDDRRELRYGPHGRDKYLAALAVVNLTGVAPHNSLDMILPGSTGVAFRCQARGLTFAQVDAGQTVADIRAEQTARCLLPWIPLMQGGDRAEAVTVWKEAADQEADQRLRTTYAGLALVFADLANCLPVWKQGLEGWNMRKSQIVEEWREEGRQEGRHEGRQEGRIEAFRDLLLRRLQKRFSALSAPEVVAAVQAQTNADELLRWLDLIDSVESLEAFRRQSTLSRIDFRIPGRYGFSELYLARTLKGEVCCYVKQVRGGNHLALAPVRQRTPCR